MKGVLLDCAGGDITRLRTLDLRGGAAKLETVLKLLTLIADTVRAARSEQKWLQSRSMA